VTTGRIDHRIGRKGIGFVGDYPVRYNWPALFLPLVAVTLALLFAFEEHADAQGARSVSVVARNANVQVLDF
jgi:hypothetical protein